jgi:hypothetical protein
VDFSIFQEITIGYHLRKFIGRKKNVVYGAVEKVYIN